MLTACFGVRRKTGKNEGCGRAVGGCCVIATTGRSLLAAAAMSLAACATQGDANLGGGLDDPFEEVNRATFEFNIAVDDAIGKPIALAYRTALPRPVRDGIRNVADNLNSPVTLVNDLLQGEFTRAQITLGRFLINTTVGIFGISDVAKNVGLPGHREDFGQTLAVWGIGAGPYIVVPFLGPKTTRNLSGAAVDFGFNPFGYVLAANDLEWVGIVGTTIDLVDQRERLIEAVDGLKKTSLDFYTAARSSYWQARLAAINNGRVPPTVPGDDDIDIDLDDEPETIPDNASPKRQSAEHRSAARSR